MAQITVFDCGISPNAGSFPLILVGLVDGSLALAAVLKASVHLTPELQITDMGRCIKGTYHTVYGPLNMSVL